MHTGGATPYNKNGTIQAILNLFLRCKKSILLSSVQSGLFYNIDFVGETVFF